MSRIPDLCVENKEREVSDVVTCMCHSIWTCMVMTGSYIVAIMEEMFCHICVTDSGPMCTEYMEISVGCSYMYVSRYPGLHGKDWQLYCCLKGGDFLSHMCHGFRTYVYRIYGDKCWMILHVCATVSGPAW